MAEGAIQRGAMVTIVDRGDTWIMLPDRDVNLGKVTSDHRILIRERRTILGSKYEPEVLTSEEAAALSTQVNSGWQPQKPDAV
jgi:hypothetical protein